MAISSSELIHRNKVQVESLNKNTLLRSTSIVSFLCLVIIIISFFPQTNAWTSYRLHAYIVGGLSVAIALFCTATKNHLHFSAFLGTCYILFLLSYFCYFYYAKPSIPAICFFGIIILYATVYFGTVEITYLVISVYTLIFIIAAAYQNNSQTRLNIINSLAIYCFTLFIGVPLQKTKLRTIEAGRLVERERDTDPLTRLPNRIKMCEEIDKSEAVQNKNQILGVFMIDIDYFKKYNDTFGHQKGDECLHKIGAALNSAGLLTGIDFFRYGGEEFTGIVRNKNIHGFTASLTNFPYEQNAQCLLNEVRMLQIPFNSGVSKTVTLSCGFVVAPEENSPHPEKLIEMADEALYRAKETGRNKAVRY